jgi:hypothetical protein
LIFAGNIILYKTRYTGSYKQFINDQIWFSEKAIAKLRMKLIEKMLSIAEFVASNDAIIASVLLLLSSYAGSLL